MKLSELCEGRDNNFNLIRLLAAVSVLLSHSFILAAGTVKADPLWHLVGMEIGAVAVDVFFVTSGFLVSASLIRWDSALDFFWGRALRIFPGLWVMLTLCVFVLGAAMTSLPAAEYFADARVYKYFFKCATLIRGVDFYLPGVFEVNPYRGAVNGSLWSMPYEVKMYIALVSVWILLGLVMRRRLAWLTGLVLTVVVLADLHDLFGAISGQETKNHLVWLTGMFFNGVIFYLMRQRIQLRWSVFGAGLMLMMVTAWTGGRSFLFVYLLTLPYLLFFLAYMPSGLVRQFNRFGDFSYGIYIYGFPVQQTLVALLPGLSAASLFPASVVLVLVLAVLSWYGCERPALERKRRMSLLSRQLCLMR